MYSLIHHYSSSFVIILVSFPHPSSPSLSFSFVIRPPPSSTLFPYTTLFRSSDRSPRPRPPGRRGPPRPGAGSRYPASPGRSWSRSEEHTSELQSRFDLVCRLLLEKKKQKVHHCINETDTTFYTHAIYTSLKH